MKEVIMVTGNLGKWEIAKEIFEKYEVNLSQEKIDTPEIQSENVEEVSKYSAEYAAKLLNKPVIKSDVGYYINALGGFPGPFLKYINGMLDSEDIINMMKNKTDRTIFLKECLTFATPTGKIKQFVNVEEATISTVAMGEGTTFDKIIIFKGDINPKSMNSEIENFNHFKDTLIIYDNMAKYLEGVDF